MAHAFVTVVVPFDDRNSDAVDGHLNALGNLAGPSIAEPLDHGRFVHFMSLTVVRGSSGGPAHLVLEASADGHPRAAVRRLARALGPQLREVLGLAGVVLSEAQVGAFLAQHERQVGQGWFAVPGVVFTGTPGMTVDRILRENALASRIQERLDAIAPQSSALETLDDVRAHLFDQGDSKWAFVAEPVPLLADVPKAFVWPILYSGARVFLWPLLLLVALACVWKGILAGLLTLGVELVVGGFAGAWAYRSLRRKERDDVADGRVDVSADAMREILAGENKCAQNHLAAVSTLKPGLLRRLTLRLALWAVGAFSRYRSRPGHLGDIGTVHFARWILLPGTDKLVFLSNYTGSWESYLEDFIAKLHEGLSGIWSNAQGFPPTQNLVKDGAEAADLFKSWARRQQHPTRCWYSAYPDLTTHRIRANAAIRHGLATATTEDEAARWLVYFKFAPAAPSPLALDEIPTLVFGGLPRLPHAQALVLRLPAAAHQARAWLTEIELAIGYGDKKKPESSTLVLGLSASGLEALGLDAQTRSTFPTAFQHGMHAPWRSRALGDCDANAPERWWWGSGEKRADAILNVYAASPDLLDEALAFRQKDLQKFGLTVVRRIRLETVPARNTQIREPFGFADGISQPLVRGSSQETAAGHNQNHVVEPGEMILGYKDNARQIPFSPHMGDQDLGANGTYLVVRQLEQDTRAFARYLEEEADRLAGDPRVPALSSKQLRTWIAAKIIGRWPDGTSLVRYPDMPGSMRRPGTPPDNDFLFGAEDPNGLRCPFGAHIRRVNPRDTFEPGSTEQLKISNRHRIVRVGRPYPAQEGSENPGLLFMCVNANIERQFEFMQQTYMLGASFHELENEVDSFARRDGLSDVLTIPTEHGPLRLRGLGSFVTVRGGAYFFMPGRATVRFLATAR